MGDIVKKSVKSISNPELVQEEISKAWTTLNKVSPYYDELYSLEEKRSKLTRNAIIYTIVLTFIFSILSQEYSGLFGIFYILLVIFVWVNRKTKKNNYGSRIQELKTNIGITWKETETCIPIDCIYSSGLSYMEKLVNTGRVSTLPEALGKLEEQEHRWTIEEQNKNIINETKRAADAAERAAEVTAFGTITR